MPIRREFRQFYSGQKWRELRARILKRAKNCCEQCGKPNGAAIFTYTWKTREPRFGSGWLYHMVWVAEGGAVWRDQFGEIVPAGCWPLRGLPRQLKAQIGVAHADNDPANSDDQNLRAWCTWCHLHHDQPFHRLTRCIRKDARYFNRRPHDPQRPNPLAALQQHRYARR